MNNTIIVENLSKKYRIGQFYHENSFRELMVNIVKKPFRKSEKNTLFVLKNISFKIKKGEVLGIIGRNGAGKSTLLKLISKITYPTTGKIKINGSISSLLEVGTGFHQELTGRENIYLNGSVLGMTKKEITKKMNQIIQFADVKKFIDTPIKRYSSGMRLRLGFSVAAHLNSDILIVDEVLAVGDAEFQNKCLKTMDELSTCGRTILFVSHNMAAIENLCSRVIWIENCKIKMDGNPSEIIKEYLSTVSDSLNKDSDLRCVENRSGTGDIRYTQIEILDPEKQPKDIIRTGDSLIVRLYYHVRHHVRNPHFGLEIHTKQGFLVASINTWTSGFNITYLSSGDGFIEFNVDSFNLIPNRYYISLWSGTSTKKFDRLNYCSLLNIETSDVYLSGREVDSRFGIVAIPCRWSLSDFNKSCQ